MAKKHRLMLITFFKVMLGFKKEIKFIIPDSYYASIYDIDYDLLMKQKIDTILFDIDNTITKVDDLNVPQETINLFENLKTKNFKLLIFSNNHVERAQPISKILDVKMLADAGKPQKEAYDKAFKIIEESLGQHFDPKLGKIFMSCRPELEDLYNIFLEK